MLYGRPTWHEALYGINFENTIATSPTSGRIFIKHYREITTLPRSLFPAIFLLAKKSFINIHELLRGSPTSKIEMPILTSTFLIPARGTFVPHF